MPTYSEVFGYKIYFWSNENNEPIHVHIVKGKPSPSATKVWLTEEGGVVCINSSKLPIKDLSKVLAYIKANHKGIVALWKSYLGYETYYC